MKSCFRAGILLAVSTAFIAHIAGAQSAVLRPNSRAEEQQMKQLAVQHELAKRWAELFIDILGEFKRDHHDPTTKIEADFSTREIRIRTNRQDREEWVSRTLTEQELATADLERTAKELYGRSTGSGSSDGRGESSR